jgi:glycosyltransferase involved in cell wall biosynthesis
MVQLLAREMARQGHSVYVMGLYPHGYGSPDYEEDGGVSIWRLRYLTDLAVFRRAGPRLKKRILQLLKYTMILQVDTWFSVRRLFRRIRRLVGDEHIGLIEMPDWNTFFQNSFLRIRVPFLGAPLMVKFNGSYSYFRQELGEVVRGYVYASERALLHRAEALSGVSQYTAARTAALFGLNKPIEILYNSIKLPDLQYPVWKEPGKIIFTGSLIYKKGIYSLLRAWNTIAPEFPDAVLDIYGKGDVETLRRLVDPGISATVRFHGHVSREVLFGELATATMAVFPSYAECFAFAPMEAMAVGCPVINSNRTSGPELITDGVNGLLVDPDDTGQISEAIVRLLRDPELRDKLALAGKSTIESKFDIRRSVSDHLHFYNKVIHESSALQTHIYLNTP